MKSLKDYIIEEGLNDVFNKVKQKIALNYDDKIKVDNDKIEVKDAIKNINNNVSKSATDKANADELIKDIITIVTKEPDEFKKIVDTINEYGKDYDLAHITKDKECTEYLRRLCATLTHKFNWEGLLVDEGSDSEDDKFEGTEVKVNISFIAYVLSTISSTI